MKKIFAILISLLFVASTFGIASVMAPPSSDFDCCDPENFYVSKTSVKVGETFTVSFNSLCIPQIMDEDQEEFVEKINFKIYDGNGNILENFDPRTDWEDWPQLLAGPDIWYEWTYEAVKMGTVVFEAGCYVVSFQLDVPNGKDGPLCQCPKTVTITSRALPMDKFMKFFGLGKFKE